MKHALVLREKVEDVSWLDKDDIGSREEEEGEDEESTGLVSTTGPSTAAGDYVDANSGASHPSA